MSYPLFLQAVRPYAQHGFTLIELMIVVVIVAVLAALAAPSFKGMPEKRRLVAATEAIYSDLQWARSSAIKSNSDATVTFVGTSSWEYHITGGATKDVEDTLTADEYRGISLASITFTGNAVTFNRIRGTATNGSVSLSSPSGYQLNVVVSILGRVRICSPTNLMTTYYDAC